MTTLRYNNNRIIPAPFVNINKEYVTAGDGSKVGQLFNITLTGNLISYKGSPDSDGDFYTGDDYPSDETIDDGLKLNALQRKQEAIRDLFSTDGQLLEIKALDATSVAVSGAPRVLNIDFPEGLWYDRCEYTVTLQCDDLYGLGGITDDDFSQYLSSANEEWSIDTNVDQPEGIYLNKTYTLTHNISAVGKRHFNIDGSLNKEAWEEARDWVTSRLGFDQDIALASGALNLPSYYGGYNHVRTVQPGIKDGSYAISETWILASGTALDDFTVQINESVENPYNTVTIDGSVTGLSTISASGQFDGSTNSKWVHASGRFDIVDGLALARAQSYSGLTLNVTPLNKTTIKNPLQGFINYTYEYDNRPRALVSGVKSEVITVSDTFGGQDFASIFVLGRAAGPVLQDLNTKPANVRSLNMELALTPPTITSFNESDLRTYFFNENPRYNVAYSGFIQTVIDAVNPSNNGFSTVYSHQPQENWSPRDGRYSYTQEWTYE